MDSGDEDENASGKAEVAAAGSSSPEKESEEVALQLPESMRDISSFGHFLQLTPALRNAAAELTAQQLTELCEAAARIKFFDGELFDDVFVNIRKRLRKAEFNVAQVTLVVASLVDLNACDSSIFSAAAPAIMPHISTMSKAQRLQWLKLLAAAKHPCDEEFEVALRTTALPEGEGELSAHEAFMLCWDYVKTGGCPRGSGCRWNHPKKDKDKER
eukprot:gnl/TRDRNA2_/TRDRNA2_133023_c0_seq2.p1 gnl/TRDRNA2_/TRDRNA2_133023_c0~~gnl/TRDRNA2_/TRDRNA2_133023_c0_seq2.p1  ORF type:complete len:215 (-),score=46.28 gnl/TRDRNA2_/TRDRNA2_133023_c0_seq2:67-711(-)